MNKIYTVLIGLIILVLTATSASAAIEKDDFGGEFGEAYWNLTNLSVHLHVEEYVDYFGNHTYISVYGYGDEYNIYGGKMIPNTSDLFTVDKKLKSASLSEVTFNVTVYNYSTYTSEVKPMTIEVDWVGEGDLTKIKYMYMVNDDSKYKESVKGNERDATATGTLYLDGVNVIGDETSDYARISQFDGSLKIKE